MKLELRVVFRNLGLLLVVLSVVIVSVALFAALDPPSTDHPSVGDFSALFITSCISAVCGGLLFLAGRGPGQVLGQREAFLLVALSWICAAGISALPFRIWAALQHQDAGTAAVMAHDFDSYVNCYFEAMSGLTTTGSTILQSISTLPRSLLLWRSLTHWLGGLGIVVLFVAVLPMLGGGSRRVYRIEAPGPSPDGVKPRIQDTARVLWLIYSGLTVAEIIALRFCGMSWFDSVCHTFATLATGGFSTSDASIEPFSRAIQIVIIVFMIMAGINFSLYHKLFQRRWRSVRKDPELRVYLAILLAATVVITISLTMHRSDRSAAEGPADLATNIHDAAFQVVAIQTTTGFCNADFDQWGFVAKATLLALMFVGGCAGSTGGGLKVVRIIILFKVVLAEIEHAYRPHVVRPVKIGKTPISSDIAQNTIIYIVVIAILFCIGTALLMLFESGNIDITSAATAAIASLNNIGPGLAKVGATHNYAWFGDPSKIVMCVLMLLGRLEVFTVIALLSPRFWREE